MYRYEPRPQMMAGGSARGDRVPVQFVSGMSIRDMNLDFRSFEYFQGISSVRSR